MPMINKSKIAIDYNYIFDSILHCSIDAIGVFDSEFNIISFNPSFKAGVLELYGVQVFSGISLEQLVSGKNIAYDSIFTFWSRVLNGERFTARSKIGLIQYKRKIFDINFAPIRNQEKKIIGGSLIVKEYVKSVDQKRVEHMIDNSPVMMWISEIDQTCSYLSKQWYEFTGKKNNNGLGFGWLDSVHPEDRDSFRVVFDWATKNKCQYSTDYRIRRADGQYRWCLDSGNPRFNDFGEFTGFIGYVMDVHERKIAEDKLLELNLQLTDALSARDEFLSIASHELKTPLTSLKLQAQIMQRAIARNDPNAFSAERIKTLVQQAEKQTNRLTRLVEDMLDISRIRTGRLTIKKDNVDFCDLIADIVERLGDLYDKKNIINIQFHQRPIIGNWDRFRLEQVIVNLISNAFKYGQNSLVEVDVSIVEKSVLLKVKDCGVGISKDKISKIFEKFERGDLSSLDISGMGLGLFISKQIIKAHFGKIWVESIPGNVTTFFVELPLSA